jgi:hypothetical protein
MAGQPRFALTSQMIAGYNPAVTAAVTVSLDRTRRV